MNCARFPVGGGEGGGEEQGRDRGLGQEQDPSFYDLLDRYVGVGGLASVARSESMDFH